MRSFPLIAFGSMLWLASNSPASASCGQSSSTITNLPEFALSGFQVNGLNQAGQVTGFYYIAGSHPPHAFVYLNGALTDLGTLGGSMSQGFSINGSGQVVGDASLVGDQQTHAFSYSGGTMKDIGTLGGSSSSASVINDVGQAAGQSTTAGNASTVAFFYNGATLKSLGTLGGNYSSAVALNNLGVVVGQSTVAGGDTHGFIYANGTLKDMKTLGGTYSSAFALNDSGLVAGESTIANGDNHGCVCSGGVLSDVGTLGGTYSSVYAVNTNNEVIGMASTLNDQEYHAVLFSGGLLQDLGTLGWSGSYAAAINNLGQIAGMCFNPDGSQHAFLWQKGQMVDLNSMLPPNSGWELNQALFINDSGRVVGVGTYHGLSQWFIMDPANASANQPPIANAGPDITADCEAVVTLNGTASSDPDGDPLAFQWALGATVLGTNPVVAAALPLGTNLVTLTVTDPCGASSQANLVVRVVDTTPPTGSCPTNFTISVDANCQAAVPDLLSQLVAQDNCAPAQSLTRFQDPPAGTPIGLGPHTITFVVSDPSGNRAVCTAVCTVVDTTPPVILSTPGPLTVAADSHCQGTVPNVISNVVAVDNCTAPGSLTVAQSPAPGTLLLPGQYGITVTVADASGNSSVTMVQLTVSDATPPVFQSLTVSPSVLWSPNHQMIPVTVSAVLSDSCDPGPVSRIVSITSDEPAAPGEIQITGPLTAALAASKNRTGNTRVYTITVQSNDASGNTTTGIVTVVVPNSNSSGSGTSSVSPSPKAGRK